MRALAWIVVGVLAFAAFGEAVTSGGNTAAAVILGILAVLGFFVLAATRRPWEPKIRERAD